MSKKSSSSRMRASFSADSTSASGVGAPYFSSRSFSSEPAFTPILIGTPRSLASLAMSRTLSWYLMLPGLIRRPWMPASRAAMAYFHWKWMSATTGTVDFAAIAASASASSQCGTATRTMSTPAATNEAICCSVALMSAVLVVVIDWMLMGASPPIGTVPIMIRRVVLRGVNIVTSSLRSRKGRGGRRSTAEHVKRDRAGLRLVHLEEDEPLPRAEAGLPRHHRDGVGRRRQQHRLHVRMPVRPLVLVHVLRADLEVVVGVVDALVRDHPRHLPAEVGHGAVLPLVDQQGAGGVGAEGDRRPVGHAGILDRALEILGEIQERVSLRRRDLDRGGGRLHPLLLS